MRAETRLRRTTGHAWAPRDRAAATRLGLNLLVAGVVLHVGLLIALGTARSGGPLQWTALVAQVLACLVVWVWGSRLPARTWDCLTLVVTPVVGALPPFYPQAALLSVPLLFLLVVFVSRSLGPAVARAVTGEALVVTLWLSWQLSSGVALASVNVLFIGGVLVLVHRALVQGVEAQERLVSELEHEARIDGVTGVLSRQAFEDRIDVALMAGSELTTCLLLVDLDNFKKVNDLHGHPVGDAALRHVAELIATGVRHASGVVGRLGGDELGVLLIDCPQEVALSRARSLVAAVRDEPLQLDSGQRISLTISVGVAGSGVGQRAELYALADAALYDAKRRGRDQASVQAEGDRRDAPHR